MAIVQRSMQLAGHVSSLLSQKRRVAVMTKVNNAYASMGKEEFPGAGKDLFGKGFEARLKQRTETAKAISDAKRAGSQFFSSKPSTWMPTSLTWRVMEHIYPRAATRTLAQSSRGFQGRGRSSNFPSQPSSAQ